MGSTAKKNGKYKDPVPKKKFVHGAVSNLSAISELGKDLKKFEKLTARSDLEVVDRRCQFTVLVFQSMSL